jgi:tetratricopeptide (TPR) repeat protein
MASRERRGVSLKNQILVASVFLSGCSMTGQSSSSNEFQVDIRNSATVAIDQDTKRASSAMHSFLIGQLAYDEEEMDEALRNFVQASSSTDGAAPLLNTRLAELYISDGQLAKALAETEKAVAAEPSNEQYLLLKAGILDAMGKSPQTAPLYEKARTLNPQRLDASVLLANLYLSQSQGQQALQVLEALAKVNPRDPMAWYFLGRAQDRLSQTSHALSSFRQAEERDPQNITLSLESLRSLLKLKRIKEAKELGAQIAKKDPQNMLLASLTAQIDQGEAGLQNSIKQLNFITDTAESQLDVRFRLSLIKVERRAFREAAQDLRLVLAAEPDNAQARYYLGSLYAGSGRKREAIEQLYHIGRDQDLYVKSRTFAAFILRQDGELKRAEEAVREALDAEPTNRNILSYLILILRDAKKFDEAEKLMRQSLAEDPQNDRLLFNYAILLHDMGKEAEADATMERVLELNEKNTDALNFLAYGLADSNTNLPRALELIQRALQVRPNDGYYLDTLGWIYYKLEKYAEAEETLSRAASAVTEDIVIQEHYADSLVKVGKIDRAADVYRNALERGRDQNDKAEVEALDRIEKKLERLSEQRSHFSAELSPQ